MFLLRCRLSARRADRLDSMDNNDFRLIKFKAADKILSAAVAFSTVKSNTIRSRSSRPC